MDLSVFCDCFEEVISKISISSRLSFDLPLDGLVLPRGWLSTNGYFSSKDVDIALTVALLDCVQDLLMRLQTDTVGRKQLQASANDGTDSMTFRDIHAIAWDQTIIVDSQCLYL